MDNKHSSWAPGKACLDVMSSHYFPNKHAWVATSMSHLLSVVGVIKKFIKRACVGLPPHCAWNISYVSQIHVAKPETRANLNNSINASSNLIEFQIFVESINMSGGKFSSLIQFPLSFMEPRTTNARSAQNFKGLLFNSIILGPVLSSDDIFVYFYLRVRV